MLNVLTYTQYCFNESKITELTQQCQSFAKKYPDDLKRFQKIQTYVLFITIVVDLMINEYALTKQPIDVLYNYMWTFYFTGPIMAINMKHLLCCYCLYLVHKSIFNPMYIKRKGNFYIKIEETLEQSHDLTERINTCFGIYPLICLVILLIHVTFMLKHFSHTNLKIDIEIFVKLFEPAIFLWLLVFFMTLIITRFVDQKPNMDGLLRFSKRVPVSSSDDEKAQKRLSKRLHGCNDYYSYSYSLGFSFKFDLKFLLSYSTIFCGIFYEILVKQILK